MMTQVSHCTTLACSAMVIPVPVSIASRPARRIDSASSASCRDGMPAMPAACSRTYGSTASRSSASPVTQWTAGAWRIVAQQLAGDVGEDRVVGARPGGEVPGGEPGGLACAGVDDPDLRSFPQLAQHGGRARHRCRVAMGDDRVHADVDEQSAAGVVRNRLQPGEAPDQGRGHCLGSAVNGQRAEPGRRSDRPVQRLSHPVAGGVHAEPAAEENAYAGWAVAAEDCAQPGGEVIKAVLPADRGQRPDAAAGGGA
jgi:hypothetical protein